MTVEDKLAAAQLEIVELRRVLAERGVDRLSRDDSQTTVAAPLIEALRLAQQERRKYLGTPSDIAALRMVEAIAALEPWTK